VGFLCFVCFGRRTKPSMTDAAVYVGHADNTVSMDEIRDFRTSMSARRFPALRDLKDEDIASLVLAERKSRLNRVYTVGKTGAAAERASHDTRRCRRLGGELTGEHTHSSVAGSTLKRGEEAAAEGAGVHKPVLKRAPFSPANPAKARDEIERRGPSAFHSINTPYELEVFRYIPDEQLLPFVPSSASQAKKTVQVNYYLNSPDAETQDMERMYIAERSAGNTSQLRADMRWERGHASSRHKIQLPEGATEYPTFARLTQRHGGTAGTGKHGLASSPRGRARARSVSPRGLQHAPPPGDPPPPMEMPPVLAQLSADAAAEAAAEAARAEPVAVAEAEDAAE